MAITNKNSVGGISQILKQKVVMFWIQNFSVNFTQTNLKPT